MSEICTKCGLPKELCVCEQIAREKQKIVVSTEKRKFGKINTIITGIQKDVNIKDIAKKLKNKFACGGTSKDNTIELQGDHRQKAKEELIALGFASESIEIK
jgi:translation initiation factor 1